MNAERLHVIARAVSEDLETTALEENLQQLVNHLQNQVNQPNQPQHQQQVSETLSKLYQALENAPSNDFPPTWRQALTELGGEGLLGQELRTTIEEIFSRNQITPSVALEEIKELNTKVQNLRGAFEQVITAFEELGIGADDLEPGECELGVLVPRSFVKNKLDELGEELTELNKIFNVFAEVATGSRPGFEIRSLSSSDLTVLLDLAPEIAACLAIAVERIVALYKKLLEIRKLHNDLKERGVPKQKLKGVEDHANTVMDEGIEKLIPKLIKQFYKEKDDGRKNELSTELRFALKKIAGRIDRGYNIEIRVEPVQEDEGTEEASPQTAKYVQAIKSAAQTMQFIKEEGEPILSLPESKDNKEKKK